MLFRRMRWDRNFWMRVAAHGIRPYLLKNICGQSTNFPTSRNGKVGINRNEKQRHDGSYLHQLTS